MTPLGKALIGARDTVRLELGRGAVARAKNVFLEVFPNHQAICVCDPLAFGAIARAPAKFELPGGIITTENIRASRLTLTLSGSGVLRAGGTATRLDISLGGSGDAQLEQLVARDAHAVVTGSGRIVVTATHSLDASVPGSGAIVYHGDPAHVTTSLTGSGAVTRG